MCLKVQHHHILLSCCKHWYLSSSLSSRKGQTAVEYALATLAAFVIAMSFYLLFDLKVGKNNRNLMELQYYTIENTVTKGWP
jgi:hypothetical protein